MKKMLLITLALPIAATAEPLSTTCTNGSDVRKIEVVYPQEGAELPCEVLYTKNGETRTLWTAGNQAGFCEGKAEEFIAKQRGWGWQCDSADTPTQPTAKAGNAGAEEPASVAESD